MAGLVSPEASPPAWMVAAFWLCLHMLFSLQYPSLCPSLLFSQGHQSDGIRAHSNDLILTESPLYRLCLQIQSESEVLGVRASAYEWGGTIHPITPDNW